jgi:DNA-binding winged helix-turn-helix (wHTH) protein/tetratricopeptide (TPR) repeat protein
VETSRFGPFELRADGSLLREGRTIDLPPKQRGLLQILAGAGGRLVSKAEILDRLWPGEDVSEASLTTCVRGLRLALEDRRRHGGYVETVHGRGYRFQPLEAAKREPPRLRIAVAPFACADAAERYLAEGLAGEVAAGLDRWSAEGIEAIARSSAERSWTRGAASFAEELDLDFVVAGRVAGPDPEVRVAVELVRADGGAVEWEAEFVGSETGSALLAAEIAEALAKRLLVPQRAVPAQAVRPLSTDPRAYRAVLRGYFLNQYRDESGLQRSIACFEQAIGWDPGCAAAHAALGEAYLNLGFRGYAAPRDIAPLARQALARSLAIDPASPLAHAARAFLAALVDRDLAAADEALALAAPGASAHDRSAWLSGLVHAAAGRFDAALEILEAGQVTDPLSPNLAMSRILALWFAGRHDEALYVARALTEAEPEFSTAHAVRADVAATLGRHDEALRSATLADSLGRGDQLTRTGCAWAFGRSGRPDASRTLLEAFERRARTRYVSPTLMAVGYAGLGDRDAALGWLERAADAQCMWLVFAPVDPRLAELREDPRGAALLDEARLSRPRGAGRASRRRARATAAPRPER